MRLRCRVKIERNADTASTTSLHESEPTDRPGLGASLAALGLQGSDTPAVEQFVRALHAAVALLDRDARVVWTNPAFDDALGGRVANAVDWHEQIDITLEHDKAVRRALDGTAASAITRLRGQEAEVELSYSPIADGSGNVVGLVLMLMDVSARRSAEQRLRHTRFVLQQIGMASAEYLLIFDRDLRVVHANRSLGQFSADSLVGLRLHEFAANAWLEQTVPVLKRVFDTGQSDRFSMRSPQTHGEARHFDVRITPVRREGDTAMVTLVASETTEQLRAERAIATQARMIESMLEGVAVVNDAQVIEITNPAFDAMFGYRRGELIGHLFGELAVNPLAEMVDWKPANASRRANSLQLEFDGRRRDASVFAVAGVLSRFEIAGRNQSLVVLQDVSERKQLERAILQAVSREQYRIGNDLHDGLGQELTGIALMLRGVAGRLTSEYPVLLPDIDGITKLVNNAIESTRALARGLSPVNLERGGLKDALEGLAMHASELYGAKVSFAHRVSDAKPLAPELANHMYRIAQEAVRNAVRHGHARVIRLHLSIARGKVRLVIADDGSGLPDQALDGSGMGLKIMRYRARMVGGVVKFEPAEPRGTRVICECPFELSPLSAATESTPAPKRRPRKSNGRSSGASKA